MAETNSIEVNVSSHLHHNGTLDKIEGYQDHGNLERSNGIASSALAFMIVRIKNT